MPKTVHVILDKEGDGKAFDAALKGTMPCIGDPKIITKAKGTKEGQPIVMITFYTELHPQLPPDRAQVVMTARAFLMAAQAILGAHPDIPGVQERLWPKGAPGSTICGHHKGVGWTAALVEKVYLITVEGSQGVSLAFTEDEVRALAELHIDEKY